MKKVKEVKKKGLKKLTVKDLKKALGGAAVKGSSKRPFLDFRVYAKSRK